MDLTGCISTTKELQLCQPTVHIATTCRINVDGIEQASGRQSPFDSNLLDTLLDIKRLSSTKSYERMD